MVDRAQHLGRGHATARQLDRVDPDPHRVIGPAQHLNFGDARNGGHARADHALDVFGDLFGGHLWVLHRHIHGGKGHARALDDGRVLGLLRQLAADLLDLGHHLGQGHIRIRPQPHVDGDDRGRRARAGGDVIHVFRGGDGGRDRGGDEALDQVGRGTGIDRGDGDDGFLHFRVLADGQVEQALKAQEQDQQAQNGGQDRALDEDR